MSLSHPTSQIDHRKRKAHYVLDHDCDETPSSVRLQSRHKRRCRPEDSPHPLVPTEHDIPTLVTSTSVSSPQTPKSPASFPGSAIQPIVPSGKSASVHVPSPESLPAPDEIPPVVQRTSSPLKEIESPPRSPIDWVYDAYDEDFGRKVCEAYGFSCIREQIRKCDYGEATAQEWKRGSTPAVVRESFNAALRGVKPPPESPSDAVHQDLVDEDFGGKICEAYRQSRWQQAFRGRRYGDSVACEWKRGSTPEEAREAYKARMAELHKEWGPLSPTPESDDPEWAPQMEQKVR
ncbi:MAG: hypothetical protein LQ346_005266, partial [Caloplaca aetnensis]